jgi:CheY-like chemotaxis protein
MTSSKEDSPSPADAARPDARESTEGRAASAKGESGKRILIVDDNEDAAELLRELLSYLGHRVEVAHDGFTALTVAESFRPEIALLDISMPVMSGSELATRLRQHPGQAQSMRLIAITGYSAENVSTDGFDSHLLKPFDVEKLKQLIAQP